MTAWAEVECTAPDLAKRVLALFDAHVVDWWTLKGGLRRVERA